MLTYAIMFFILIFLGVTLIMGAKLADGGDHFFDQANTTALRGFWCMVVILVHTPVMYQNRIQDMIGSFAYIGVTFFFITSAYGLRLMVQKKTDYVNGFWRRRLPKLLIPCLLVNLLAAVFDVVRGGKISLWSLLWINGWVQWLFVCYVIFWAVYKFKKRHQDATICLLIAVFSIAIYLCRPWIIGTTWCPEIFGFIWGIILFRLRDFFIDRMKKRWFIKCLIFCIVAGAAGLIYLKFKMIVFFGDYLLKILLGILITLFMLAVNTRVNIGNQISKFVGTLSYEVYLLHGTVFGIISFLMPGLESGVFILLSIVITVILSAVVHKISTLLLGLGGRS